MEQSTQMLKKVFVSLPLVKSQSAGSRCVIEVFVANWKAPWKPAGYVHTQKVFKVKGISFNNT